MVSWNGRGNSFSDMLGRNNWGATTAPKPPKAPKASTVGSSIGGQWGTSAPATGMDWIAWAQPDTSGNVAVTTKSKNTKKSQTLVNTLAGGGNSGGSTGSGNTGGNSGGNNSGNTGGDTGGSDGGTDTTGGSNTGGAATDGDGFAFDGQEPLSAAGRSELVANPYAFANSWLQSLGGSFGTPTMMAVLGQFPAIADSLGLMLYGDNPEYVTGAMDDSYLLNQRRDLLAGQLERGGGINAWDTIQKMLDLGSANADKTIDQVDNPLAMTLLGLGEGGAALDSQAEQVNNLIQMAMVNSSPIYAGMVRNLLTYYKNQYVSEQAQNLDTETSAIPYVSWLRDKGILLG